MSWCSNDIVWTVESLDGFGTVPMVSKLSVQFQTFPVNPLRIAASVSIQLQEAQTTLAMITIWQSVPASPDVLVMFIVQGKTSHLYGNTQIGFCPDLGMAGCLFGNCCSKDRKHEHVVGWITLWEFGWLVGGQGKGYLESCLLSSRRCGLIIREGECLEGGRREWRGWGEGEGFSGRDGMIVYQQGQYWRFCVQMIMIKIKIMQSGN